MSQNLQNFARFQKFQLGNLVDFWKMLQNAYFLANIGADTAENEHHFAEICQKLETTLPTPLEASAKAAGLDTVCDSVVDSVVHREEVETLRQIQRGLVRPFSNAFFENAFFENAFFENAFFENFANFWRARSRLYQNEILQENMRSTAFFKLYKICILLHRCNLKIFAKKIGLKKQ